MEKKDTHFKSAVNTMTILTFLFLLFYIFEKGEVLGKTIARIGFQTKNYLNLYYQPGLFRTHDMYFKKQLPKQKHNAYIDCKVLKKIYFKFIETINKKGRKNGI